MPLPSRRLHPWRIGPDSGPWPLHDTAASKALEARALAATAPHALMERAGLAVARLAHALAPAAQHVEVWCGPGNNGGDGYVAARLLLAAGTVVTVVDPTPGATRPADARRAIERAREAGIRPVAPAQAPADAPTLVIDALLGLGTTRALQGPLADAATAINARRVPVLAVDLPTGLAADTGQPLGAAVVRATHTLSLLSLKPGLFTALGRDLAGCVWFDDLGASAEDAAVAPASATAWLLGPRRRMALPHAAHKGSRGDLWVLGGSDGMIGAAQLAARAGLAAGAGRVYLTLLCREAPAAVASDPSRPELMHRSFDTARAGLLASATLVAGCGGGSAIESRLPALLAEAKRLVLDADALNAVSREPALLRLLKGRAGRGQGTVITPHPLEAARLLGVGSSVVQHDRLAGARALAEATLSVVVLKGSGTVIASPGAPPAINPSGNAALATAGTGDVLAGWIGGLWAQAPSRPAEEVACDAVWLHGHAADLERPDSASRSSPLLAADLVAAMAQAS
ncbi:MAG: NAD(P)H-hydrate dehydratase [Rubrivivax sp.]|nr:NAD(P)H-hydrate dehydratase [Rubrivivax sp.]